MISTHEKDVFKGKVNACCYGVLVYHLDNTHDKNLAFHPDIYNRLNAYFTHLNPNIYFEMHQSKTLDNFHHIYHILIDTPEKHTRIEDLLKLSYQEKTDIDERNKLFIDEKKYTDNTTRLGKAISNTKEDIVSLEKELFHLENQLEYVLENIKLSARFPEYYKKTNYPVTRITLFEKIVGHHHDLLDKEQKLTELKEELVECRLERTDALRNGPKLQ